MAAYHSQIRGLLCSSARPAVAMKHWVMCSRCRFSNSVRIRGKEQEAKSSSLRDQLDPSNRPFQAQLWDSTYQRIARERDERARYQANQPFNGPTSYLVRFVALTAASLSLGYLFGRLNSPPGPSKASTTRLNESPPLDHETRPFILQAAWAEFVQLLGSDNVITTASELDSHSGSSWSTYKLKPEERPFMILRPGSTEDVSDIMKICHSRRIPVSSYAGGTSIEGQLAPTRGGVCIDFARMDKILQVNTDDLDIVVQPGVGWEHLNNELTPENLFFPPDPGPGAAIGGMIGTGCSGTNAARYGTMKDWVLGLTVVLADGTVVKTRRRPRNISAGYDLTRLFIGSEGTLGLVTEATLRLAPRPETESVAVCTFESIHHAAVAVSTIVKAGIPVAAAELLDQAQMKFINESGMTTRSWKEQPTIFFKFAGTAGAVKEQISSTKKILATNGSTGFEFARSKNEALELWSARKEAPWSTMAQGSGSQTRVWTTDAAVPLSQLADLITDTQKEIEKSGLTASIVGHAADGNFHSIILYDSASPQSCKLVEDLVERMADKVIEMDGTVTGEHGIGLVKRKYLERELGEESVDLMRRLKLAMDPMCLLNCDKVVDLDNKNGFVSRLRNR